MDKIVTNPRFKFELRAGRPPRGRGGRSPRPRGGGGTRFRDSALARENFLVQAAPPPPHRTKAQAASFFSKNVGTRPTTIPPPRRNTYMGRLKQPSFGAEAAAGLSDRDGKDTLYVVSVLHLGLGNTLVRPGRCIYGHQNMHRKTRGGETPHEFPGMLLPLESVLAR